MYKQFFCSFALMFVLLASACSASVNTLVEPLDDSAWEASKWISVADAPVVRGRHSMASADGASCFVSSVKNEGRVVSARWMSTGLGVYDIYVNGKLVGEEVLKPGFTHHGKTRMSFTYDVTSLMKTGAGAENEFFAQVTPGWWADKIITPDWVDGMLGTKCAFRGVLELVYADGGRKYYGTDLENWKAAIAGPVKHAGIFDGEVYDAREPLPFGRTEGFGTPEENKEFGGGIFPSEGAEVYFRHDLSLSPVKAYAWKGVEGEAENEYGKVVIVKEFASGEKITLRPGETLVVDFGQNCAAVPSFVFKADEGTHLTCLPSELLNDGNGAKSRGMDGPEGSCHRENLRMGPDFIRLEYTFGSERSYVEFTPRCSFWGYRYVSITATSEVRIKSVKSIPVTSIAERLEAGRITTGHKDVNRLIMNAYWGQLSNYLSIPTDCPQRNERMGWTADTQVFAETGTFFANTADFFHKWMHDMRDSQSHTGAFPGVSPFAAYAHADMMRLGWTDAGVIVPWVVWKQFADTEIVDENWEAMSKFVNHIYETEYRHESLTAENWNYQWADWLSYEPLESSGGSAFMPGGPRPEALVYWNFLSSSYWAMDAGMMADMAQATGRDASVHLAQHEKAVNHLRTEFFNEDGTFKTPILNTMQTPALFALKNNLFEGEAKERMIAALRDNFAEHGNRLQTGFLGTSILMSTLTDNGMADLAYELLFQRKNPSWLYSVDNGATTIWERWNSYTLENGMGPRGMNSFNHYAYGCVCEWIWETVAGIAADSAEPGFKRIIMKPVPDRRLGHIDAEYKSAAGLIRSSWKYEGDKWIWNFTVPEGSTAVVTLPGETGAEVYQAGSHTVTCLLP